MMGKASEIWKEIKPKIGEMLAAVNDIETRAEKAQEEAYQKGLSDAWEAARKICLNECDGGMSATEVNNIFKVGFYRDALLRYSASEAIEKIRRFEKIRRYEQEKEEIQVGDEVKVFERKPFIVTGFGYGDEDTVYCHGFVTENGISTLAKKDECVKTGRCFSEIAEVLRKMGRDAT